jgi:hypothetical protein
MAKEEEKRRLAEEKAEQERLEKESDWRKKKPDEKPL